MKKKIMSLMICMLLISIIPIAAGVSVESETQSEEETEGLFGITIIRGFISNVRQQGTDTTFRAIRLHYFTILSPMEKTTGIIRLQKCTVKDFAFERRWDMGLLGSFSWIFGVVRGDLEVN